MKLLTPAGSEIELICIPRGMFKFARSDTSWRTTCLFTRSFWISKLPVTLPLWRDVMDAEASLFDGEYKFVRDVSWSDMEDFCGRLSWANRERIPPGCIVSPPTQFQWERAFQFANLYSKYDTHINACNHERSVDLLTVTGSGTSLTYVANFWEYCFDSPLERNPLIGINPVGPFEPSARSLRGILCNSDGSFAIERGYGAGPATQRVRSPWNGFRLAVHTHPRWC